MLMARYQERLYGLVYRMTGSPADTDDVLQEVLVKVYLKIDQFHEKSSLYTWLYRIAVNESLTFLKKKKRRMSHSIEEELGDRHTALQADRDPDSDVIRQVLREAIAGLPDKQRIVFNLRYYEEMAYEEMSQLLDTSVGALKASYHHAVKKIERHVQQAQLL